MGLTSFIKRAFGNSDEITLSTCTSETNDKSHYKTLINEVSVNLIAKTVSMAEFQTFESGIETKRTNNYIFNVEANKNQSASLFWREVVSKMLKNGEALVLIEGEELYLADSFTRKGSLFKEKTYSEIVIGGESTRLIRKESQVLYLKDDNTVVSGAIDNVYSDYSSIIKSSMTGYQNSKTRKGKLKIPSNLPKTLQEEGALQKHVKKTMKDFMDPSKNAVYPETNGFEYDEISEAKGSKSNDSGRETKNFIDDVFSFIAISRNIPPSLLKGDTVDTKDAVNNFLAFCINPIAKIITNEINRKMYGKEQYMKNTYTKLSTSNIKSIDLSDIANSLELLTRTGSNTIDDNLRALGREPVGGDVGDMRFVTKNLELLDHVLENKEISNGKGGE